METEHRELEVPRIRDKIKSVLTFDIPKIILF